MIRSSIIHIFLALFRRHESFAAVCCRWCVRSGWIIATVWDKAGYRSIAFTTINQNKIFTFWQTRRAKSEHQERFPEKILWYSTHCLRVLCVLEKRRQCGVLSLDKYVLLMTGHARSSTQRNGPAKKWKKFLLSFWIWLKKKSLYLSHYGFYAPSNSVVWHFWKRKCCKICKRLMRRLKELTEVG